MAESAFRLITGRTIKQGVHLDDKMSDGYREAAAICEMSPAAMENINVKDGSTVLVRTEYGEVVVTARENAGNPDDLMFIPMGPWATAVVDPDTGGIGMPGFKGIDVTVVAANTGVRSVRELISSYREGAG